MALESLGSSPDFAKQETLTKKQEAIVMRVLEILEQDINLNAKVTETFQQNLFEIVGNEVKYNLLLEKLGEKRMQELSSIQDDFKYRKITNIEATNRSKEIIEHYTRIELKLLKQSTKPEESA